MYKEVTLNEIPLELKRAKKIANHTINIFYKNKSKDKIHKDDLDINMDLSNIRSIEYFFKHTNGKLHLSLIRVI